MSSKLTDMQQSEYQQLYSRHQTTRREHQRDLIGPLQQLNINVQQSLTDAKNAYEKAKESYHQEFNVLKRVFTHTASEHETQLVTPLKEIYHQEKDLAKKVVELLDETTLETSPLETREYWNGSIAVVYNPITGRAEWKKYWHGGVFGVFNPLKGVIEWKEIYHHGVYGVFNPRLNTIEWNQNFSGGIVEWKSAFHSGVGGTYNPLTRQVEWKTCFHGSVVGYYDEETQTVKWIEKWHHGLALILWNASTKTYSTTASCGWFDNE
ncbi:unnamed protein product [Adineta steineri]|uniref:Uncharacterized protein n=1 Tax=Adineta steineri TaxID=433720 RepID=A0A818NQM9_9BILA|nr:unnamed protein product [Adineta steineri]CAF3611397.1 unnamed protein product [Adineta steineri]